MPRARPDEDAVPTRNAAAATPRLSPERAFVVQLEDRPAPNRRAFRGRVEHLASGEARHFGSLTDLVGFLRHHS